MSLEAFVISPRQLESFEEWQQAIDSRGWPLNLSTEGGFLNMCGFLPVSWKSVSTGFECQHWSLEDLREALEGKEVDPAHRYVLSFRWGHDLHEAVAVAQASAAYALATDGMLFDCEEGKIKTADEAIEMARQIEAFLPEVEAALKKLST